MALKHVVIDGSNIATEGHSLPSLARLDEAVSAFLDEYHPESFTVVVDATFGHRIAKSEQAAYEEAMLAGELVCPPAGAIGRGDAFVLQIADRADSVVVSNDSFQEFHGTYAWLFDEGRLIGGKPVPAVGWVFVPRTPVRGPTSRKATKQAKGKSSRSSKKSPKKLDAPKVTIPGAKPKIGDTVASVTGADKKSRPSTGSQKRGGGSANSKRPPANEPMPYLEFVETHPVGSEVTGVVDRFSSHGAYVKIGSLEAYAPVKLMGDPPPRRARDALRLGVEYRFSVHRFDASNRGIDITVIGETGASHSADSADDSTYPQPPAQEDGSMATKKKSTAKKSTAKKSTATKSAAKKSAAKKSTARKSPAKKSPAKKSTAKKSAAKKSTAKKSTAKKSTAKKSAAKKSPAKKSTAKKSAAKKSAAKKSPAKKSPAKKSPAKKSAATKRR